jgi:16S rRNA (guanine527-N7)-methyltransferase
VTAGVPSGKLDEAVRRFNLSPRAARQLATLIDLLAGDPNAPTTIREADRILAEHVADSLAAIEVSEVKSALAIADIGAGAGFPGLPLAIAMPQASVALVESSARKCRFIERAIIACGLANARAVARRAEAWPEGIGRFDIVTARAVAPLAVVSEYAAPLLRLGGALVAWRGRRDVQVEEQAARAAAILGLEMREPIRTHPFPEAEHRYLHVMLKVSPTPTRFPRRVGVARKRPLAGPTALPSSGAGGATLDDAARAAEPPHLG